MANKVFYERPNSNKNDSQKEVIQENLIQEVVVEAEYENQYDSVPVNYQQERKDNQKEAIKKLVTNIILSILTVIFVILLVGFIYEMSEIGYRYEEDANQIWYRIEDGRYADVVSVVERNRGIGVEETPELQECYAIADYYQAASLYKVKMAVGDLEAAEKNKKLMKKKRYYFEQVSFVFDDIDIQLGIEY